MLGSKQHNFEHPHSLYIATYYYSGAVGLAILLSLIAYAFVQVLKMAQDTQRQLMPLLVYGTVVTVFDGNRAIGNMNFVWIVLWLPIAMVLAEHWRERTDYNSD